MTLLVLYEELAGYFIKCISTFAHLYNAEVHIIHKEVNKEAPFHLNINKGIRLYNRAEYTNRQLMGLSETIKPDAIFCGGWSNKAYLNIARQNKGKIPIIVGFDNKWNGSLKQQIASFIAPYYLGNKFDKCFVPGPQQERFGLKMGFRKDQILSGAYSCDFDLFHDQYLASRELKRKDFPKRFIYVGRYLEHKGIRDLWAAFIELQNESPTDWELWCLGAGDVESVIHPQIKHFGFVQPRDLPEFISQTGVFVLPSHFEPWGVVVHEFAAAGFPIICSDEVGARTTFVENNFNGYIYKSGDINGLKKALRTIINSSQEELFNLGENSVEKSKLITPNKWSEQLMSLL
jgi:glycosyltransferase involved in cell wall biosynthesis